MPPPVAPPRPEAIPRPPPHAPPPAAGRSSATTAAQPPTRPGISMGHNSGCSDRADPRGSSSTRRSKNRITATAVKRKLLAVWYFIWWHGLTLAIYTVPVLIVTQSSHPTLDEFHICSADNRDVNGPSMNRTWTVIWHNDYWGRPLTSPSSHKSWRPLSVLLFRYLKGSSLDDGVEALRMHRLVNIITHAATAELVGILAVQWYQPPASLQTTLRLLAKLLFALHPTHVEVTANAANRPHLLALLCGVLAASPSTHFLLYLLAICAGFLSCETFIFQTIAIVTTMVLVSYRRRFISFRRLLRVIVPPLLPRIVTLAMITILYLYYRVVTDTLSIPDGLIRPAENPFYHLTGPVRIKSYLYTTTLHLYKQLDFDLIGFSHEYGQNCIPPVEHWSDRRLHGVAWLLLLFYILLGKIYRYRLFYLYLAWTATLFPITGIIKVGTFVSDRLVVPSTVPVALAGSIWLFQWLTMSNRHVGRRRALLAVWLLYRYSRIYYRSLEWMDSVPLLQSSLRTCPNFAKGHMELSKVYSSLYPDLYDLKKARRHLNRAQTIDPNFCDVHQQFAIVAVKENKWMEVEKELFLSLQCPYTMGGAVPMWNDYWTQQLNGPHLSPTLRQGNQQRYRDYSEQLQRLGEEQEQAMRAKEQQGNHQHVRHPFAWKRTSV